MKNGYFNVKDTLYIFGKNDPGESYNYVGWIAVNTKDGKDYYPRDIYHYHDIGKTFAELGLSIFAGTIGPVVGMFILPLLPLFSLASLEDIQLVFIPTPQMLNGLLTDNYLSDEYLICSYINAKDKKPYISIASKKADSDLIINIAISDIQTQPILLSSLVKNKILSTADGKILSTDISDGNTKCIYTPDLSSESLGLNLVDKNLLLFSLNGVTCFSMKK